MAVRTMSSPAELRESSSSFSPRDVKGKVEAHIRSLSVAIKRRDVPMLRERLESMRGAEYKRACQRIRDSHLWSLEETLAGRLVGARAQCERWEPEYKATKQKLAIAMEQDDLRTLDATISGWPFFPGDQSIQEARTFIINLKEKEVAQEDMVKQGMMSGDAPTLRKSLQQWTFPHDTDTVKAAREGLAAYNEKRRAVAHQLQVRHLPMMKEALAALPMRTSDSDVKKARAAVEEWEGIIAAAKPKVDTAMAAKDVEALEAALAPVDFSTDDETLPMAHAALQVWKPKYYRQRAELEHAKSLGCPAVEQVLARWDFSPDDPVVAQAKEHLTAAVAAEERLRTAIASKKVAEITSIVESWKYGHSDAQSEAKAALKTFKKQLEHLQRAVKQGDVGKVEAALSALPWDADGDPDVEKAKALAEDYRAQKKVLEAAVASGRKAEVEAAVAAWTFGAKDDPLLIAQNFIVSFGAEEKKLLTLIGSKADPKDVGPLRAAVDAWPFNRNEVACVKAAARLKAYDAVAGLLHAAIQAKHMGQLQDALGAWEFSQTDSLYVEAMSHIDAFGAQIKVVREAVESKSGAQFAAALAQLEYEADDDMDIAELRVVAKSHASKVKKLEDAVASQDIEAAQELVDEWDFADDPAVEAARQMLAGGAGNAAEAAAEAAPEGNEAAPEEGNEGNE